MDDMGYGDSGATARRTCVRPNTIGWRAKGYVWTDAYANGAVCTPTRTALITGRYQQRVGPRMGPRCLAGRSEARPAATGTSLPALPTPTGYATGSSANAPSAGNPSSTDHPWVDEFYGFLSGAHDYLHPYL